MHKTLETMYGKYLQDLDNGTTERIALPPRERTGITGKAWASSLTYCPWKAYQQEQGNAPTLPLPPDVLHKMQGGVRMGEMLQEAAVYAYGPEVYEVSLEGEKVRGRVDLLLPYEGGQAVVEIKTVREPLAIKQMAFFNARPLRLSHVYQALAYGLIVQTPHIYIVTLHREWFNTWQVVVEGDYINVLDENGQEWDGLADLTSDELSTETFWEEVERQYQFMQGHGQPMPIADPLNDPHGWECIEKDHSRKTYVAACGQWCRTDIPEGGKYVGNRGNYVVTDIF